MSFDNLIDIPALSSPNTSDSDEDYSVEKEIEKNLDRNRPTLMRQNACMSLSDMEKSLYPTQSSSKKRKMSDDADDNDKDEKNLISLKSKNRKKYDNQELRTEKFKKSSSTKDDLIYRDRDAWNSAIDTIKANILKELGDANNNDGRDDIEQEFRAFKDYTPFCANKTTKKANIKKLAGKIVTYVGDNDTVYNHFEEYFKNKTFALLKTASINYPKIYGDNFHFISHPLVKQVLYKTRRKGLKYDVQLSGGLYSPHWIFPEDGFIKTDLDSKFLLEHSNGDERWAPIVGCIIKYAGHMKKNVLMPFNLCTKKIVKWTNSFLQKHNYDLRYILKVEQGMIETVVDSVNVMNAAGYVGRIIISFEHWMNGVIKYTSEFATPEETISFVIAAMKFYNVIPDDLPWTYAVDRPDLVDIDTHNLYVGPKNAKDYPICIFQLSDNKIKENKLIDQKKLIKLDSKSPSMGEFSYENHSVVVKLFENKASKSSQNSDKFDFTNKVTVNVCDNDKSTAEVCDNKNNETTEMTSDNFKSPNLNFVDFEELCLQDAINSISDSFF